MLLTPDQVREFRLLHGRVFVAACDDCGTLIPGGDLFVSARRSNGRGDRTTCVDTYACKRKTSVAAATKEDEREQAARAPRTKREKRDALKDKLSGITIDPAVRRSVIRILREDTETKFDTKLLVTRLLRKSSMRELPKGVLRSTIKGMRVKKEIRRKKGVWVLLLKEKVEA